MQLKVHLGEGFLHEQHLAQGALELVVAVAQIYCEPYQTACAGRKDPRSNPTVSGASSTRAEIYSKPPPKRLLGVIFHSKTAKMGIWPRLLREILAHNTDCMQVSNLTSLYFTQ